MAEETKTNKTLSTEKVFDMLPMVTELYDKLDIDTYSKEIKEKNKGKKDIDVNILGIDLFKYILKNSQKIKQEVFEIVSIMDGKSIEEVKTQDIFVTFNTFKELFSNKEVMSFFEQAVR